LTPSRYRSRSRACPGSSRRTCGEEFLAKRLRATLAEQCI
jgi:hypothetical protein